MSHWRKLFDERFVGSWDFEGKPDATVTIKSIAFEKMRNIESQTDVKKPVLYFEKAKKGLVLNRTNAATIAELYGSNTDKWIGQRVTLFATTCQAFGKQVECVRVKI